MAVITAFKGAVLIDGTGAPAIRHPVILVDGDRISKVGDEATVQVPPGAQVIDAGECTLMPGMMDLHVHLAMFNSRSFRNYRVAQAEVSANLQQMYALFHSQLCFDMGFTTLRDLGVLSHSGPLVPHLCAVRDAINAGIFAGPRLLVGAVSGITNGHQERILPQNYPPPPGQSADGPWELRKMTRINLRYGCDVIKAYTSGGIDSSAVSAGRKMTQEELDAIVDEAHTYHKTVAVHCFTPEAQRMALTAGADTIEHTVFHSEEMIQKIVEAGTYVVPTLLHRSDEAIAILGRTGAPAQALANSKKIQPYVFETFQKMHKSGVKMAMGSDMGYEPGFGTNAGELSLYVEYGMTPMEAIQAATIHAARAIKRDHDLGSLEIGKLADIVAVRGDPLADIGVLRERENIRMVIKEGTVCVDRRPGSRKDVLDCDPDTWAIVD
jgi:imidazolonepropionase-like amidohydrolase